MFINHYKWWTRFMGSVFITFHTSKAKTRNPEMNVLFLMKPLLPATSRLKWLAVMVQLISIQPKSHYIYYYIILYYKYSSLESWPHYQWSFCWLNLLRDGDVPLLIKEMSLCEREASMPSFFFSFPHYLPVIFTVLLHFLCVPGRRWLRH